MTYFLSTACLMCSLGIGTDPPDQLLETYNVVWNSPSRDSSGSMPLGNGDIGLNVWVEQDGDLLFYLSKTDAWCGAGRLLKLGRVRVSLDPNPFRAGLPFRQTLRLREGEIEIVAGLHAVTDRLLGELPANLAIEARADWQRLHGLLPELPVAETEGRTRLLPAARFDQLSNSENPELYAVFPYRLHALGRPDVEVGRETFSARRVKRTGGWSQDPIQAALLGLTDRAAADTYHNFNTKHDSSRFPAFWGPNFDWVPDQDHGGVAMIALQRMLMQCDGDQILVLPAWPRQWNVDFRLHAPRQTTVRVVWREGRLQVLDVQPPERRQDVAVAVRDSNAIKRQTD